MPGPVNSYRISVVSGQNVLSERRRFSLIWKLPTRNKYGSNSFIFGPLRDFPKRHCLWAPSRPTDVGRRGEKAIDAILAATHAQEGLRKIKRKGPGARNPISGDDRPLAAAMGLIESFTVDEIAKGSNRWQAHVKTRRDGSDVLLTDVGFGVSQVLPVVTLLQYVPEGSTVILEQPEIHLRSARASRIARTSSFRLRDKRGKSR